MRKGLLIPLLGLLVAMIGAAPAKAALTIEDFKTTATESEAGSHPDLHTHFKLGNDGGATEVAKNISFDAPRGLFGNPRVLTQCTALDFSQQQCPSDAQVGYVELHSGFEEIEVEPDPENEPGIKVKKTVPGLLGVAPIFTVEPGPEEAARFAFYVPTLNIPIAIPVTVRSATDYGLRFTVSNITQAVPLNEADLTFWGFPAATKTEPQSHDQERFAKGVPGNPAGCTKDFIREFAPFPTCVFFYNIFGPGVFEPVQLPSPTAPSSVCLRSAGSRWRPSSRSRPISARVSRSRPAPPIPKPPTVTPELPAGRPSAADHQRSRCSLGH